MRAIAASILVASGLTVAGCSSDSGGSTGATTQSTTSGAQGGSGGAPGTGSLASGTGGKDGGVIDPDAACAAEEAKTELAPLDMYIMMDKSGSMEVNTDGTPNMKWASVKQALKAFMQ